MILKHVHMLSADYKPQFFKLPYYDLQLCSLPYYRLNPLEQSIDAKTATAEQKNPRLVLKPSKDFSNHPHPPQLVAESLLEQTDFAAFAVALGPIKPAYKPPRRGRLPAWMHVRGVDLFVVFFACRRFGCSPDRLGFFNPNLKRRTSYGSALHRTHPGSSFRI